MSEQVLAMPYPWQQDEWQHLYGLYTAHRLPHAILLSGTKGLGKQVFATAFAQLLLCDAPVKQLPCGNCRSCQLNLAGTHPDLLVVTPEEKSKVIKIQQIRALTDFVSKTAQQGGRKVVLLDPAEAMNASAANALLKSLEEPAGDTTLLLISHGLSYVMPTIRSRCQQLRFPVPPKTLSLGWLTPLCGGNSPEQLLALSGGAPLAARALLEEDRLEQREQTEKVVLGLCQQELSPLEAANQWSSFDPLELFQWILTWLHQGVVAQNSAETGVLSDATTVLAQVEPSLLFRLYDKLLRQKQQLLSGANPNKQLVLEELAMDLSTVTRNRPARQVS